MVEPLGNGFTILVTDVIFSFKWFGVFSRVHIAEPTLPTELNLQSLLELKSLSIIKYGLKNIYKYAPADVSYVPYGLISNVKYDVDVVSCDTRHGWPVPNILSEICFKNEFLL